MSTIKLKKKRLAQSGQVALIRWTICLQ